MSERGASRFKVRPLTAADISEVATLKQTVFGRPTSAARIQHLYLEHPWGSIRSLVAEREGTVVGAICGASRPLQVGDETVVSRQAADVMVLPEARGRLLLRRLLHVGLEGVWAGGGTLGYGFPNRVSEPHIALSRRFELILAARFYFRALRPGPLHGLLPRGALRMPGRLALEAASRIPLPARIERAVKVERTLPGDVDDLWAQQSRLASCQTVRNLEYLNWRYEQAPVDYEFLSLRADGRLAALAVLAEVEVGEARGVAIADWLLSDRREFPGLLAAAVRSARASGAAFVVLATLAPYDSEAMRMGFLPVPERLAPAQLHMWAAWPDDWTGRHLVRSPRNWFLTLGDSDLV